ncbi:MAG: hypothetical protein QF537_19125 [SAR324 cluster bacterium]|nr:hypothetical protein [SAR324 cluster bacterium]
MRWRFLIRLRSGDRFSTGSDTENLTQFLSYARQNHVSGLLDITGKVDLDPWQSGYVFKIKPSVQ